MTWAIHTFRPHVHGTKFRLVTDHQPLLWLMKARDLNGQYARWQMMLQEHDFEIEHRAGVKHNNADVLSRFPMAHTHDRTGTQFDPDPVAGRGGGGHIATHLREEVARAAEEAGATGPLHQGPRPVRGKNPAVYDPDFDYGATPLGPGSPLCASRTGTNARVTFVSRRSGPIA